MSELNAKQQAFIEEYIVDFNGTQAAIRAGYSEHTANEQSSQLLAKLNIQEALAEALLARSDRVNITRDEVIGMLRREANFFDEGATHGGRVTAITQLGRHLALFTDKLETKQRLTHEEALEQLKDD